MFLKGSDQILSTPRPSEGLPLVKELEKLGVKLISDPHQGNSTNNFLSPPINQELLDSGGGSEDEATKMERNILCP